MNIETLKQLVETLQAQIKMNQQLVEANKIVSEKLSALEDKVEFLDKVNILLANRLQSLEHEKMHREAHQQMKTELSYL